MHSGKGPPNLGAGTHCLRLADKQPAKCEVAHTSPPLARGTRTGTGTTRLLEPGGVHGTKTSEFRICHRDGVDRPRGPDVGDGFAGHITDLPPSASAFVLANLIHVVTLSLGSPFQLHRALPCPTVQRSSLRGRRCARVR